MGHLQNIQHFNGFRLIPKSTFSVTDMGFNTLESFWSKQAVQFVVVGLFVNNFLIDGGLALCRQQ